MKFKSTMPVAESSLIYWNIMYSAIFVHKIKLIFLQLLLKYSANG